MLQHKGQAVADQLDEDAGDGITRALGLSDFYSVHILNFCEGTFVPDPNPHAFLSMSSVSRNVTSCSSITTGEDFDLQSILRHQLTNSSGSKSLLKLPEQIDTGLTALQWARLAALVLYYIAIALMVFAVALTAVNTCCCSCGVGSLVASLAE